MKLKIEYLENYDSGKKLDTPLNNVKECGTVIRRGREYTAYSTPEGTLVAYMRNGDFYSLGWDDVQSKFGDSGYDLRAAISEPIELKSKEWKLIPTGIKVQLDTIDYYTVAKDLRKGIVLNRIRGKYNKDSIIDMMKHIDENFDAEEFEKEFAIDYEEVDSWNGNVEIQVRPRSGMALKQGISIMNTPGTVDYSYKGEVGVILTNHSDKDIIINPGDRIAQMVVCPICKPEIDVVDAIDLSGDRGGGFGHSGNK